MAIAPLSQTIFLTEDGTAVANPSPVTIPPLVVVPQVTLGALTLSGPLTVGAASTGTIAGATDGSTIAEAIAGLTVDSTARTYAWDGSGSAGTVAEGLVETHPNATNSGRASPVTIGAAPVTPPAGTVTIDSTVQRSGQTYIFTARRTGDLSAPLTRTMQVGASTDYPPGSPASDWPGGAYPTATASFAAGSPTATFQIAAPVAAQPE